MKFAIGSDPEFAFTNDKGDVIPAFKVLHSKTVLQDTIGLDARISTAELRPIYSPSTYVHLNNIFRAKGQISNICNQFGINAVAAPIVGSESLGGHIHISTDYSRNVNQDLVADAVVLQFLALPAAKFLFGQRLYTRYKQSGFRYGSPYDVRADWGKNHIELRMFPTFLGLNNQNIKAILDYYVDGFVYMQHHDLSVPGLKKSSIRTAPVGFTETLNIDREKFDKLVDKMYRYAYSEKLGFAMKFYRSLNKLNNDFVIARHGRVTTNILQYSGIVQYLSPRVRSRVQIIRGADNIETRNGVTYVSLSEKIPNDQFISDSIRIGKKILEKVK